MNDEVIFPSTVFRSLHFGHLGVSFMSIPEANTRHQGRRSRTLHGVVGVLHLLLHNNAT